jgi:hypothetical protein
MVYEERVEPYTVQVCRMESYEETVQVPRVVQKRVPVTYTYRVPRTVVMRIPIDSPASACCGQTGPAPSTTSSGDAPTPTFAPQSTAPQSTAPQSTAPQSTAPQSSGVPQPTEAKRRPEEPAATEGGSVEESAGSDEADGPVELHEGSPLPGQDRPQDTPQDEMEKLPPGPQSADEQDPTA